MSGRMGATSKRRTNVSIDAELLAAARELGLNVSAITEAALAERVRAARAAVWAAENAEALAARRDCISPRPCRARSDQKRARSISSALSPSP